MIFNKIYKESYQQGQISKNEAFEGSVRLWLLRLRQIHLNRLKRNPKLAHKCPYVNGIKSCTKSISKNLKFDVLLMAVDVDDTRDDIKVLLEKCVANKPPIKVIKLIKRNKIGNLIQVKGSVSVLLIKNLDSCPVFKHKIMDQNYFDDLFYQ